MRLTLVLVLLSVSGGPLLADVARDVRDGRLDLGNPDGGFFELGPRMVYRSLPVAGVDDLEIQLHIGGYYRFKRFFFDFSAESHNRVQIGYNAYSGPLWSIDLLGASGESGIDGNLSDELEDFDDRPPLALIGIRATAYSGPLIAQFEAFSEVHDDIENGVNLTGSLARTWLIRNWNAHLIVSARYYSAGYNDYIYGIDPDEATPTYPAYKARASVSYVTEIGFSYPLSESWVFRTQGRYWALAETLKQSPFLSDDSYTEVGASLMFVY